MNDQNEENGIYYYHADHLGSSSVVTDKNGKFHEHLEFFPYGETWINDRANNENLPYKFTGKELDPETGLYYFGARYYDSRLSRWISADPILNSYLDGKPNGGVYNYINLDLYNYCAGNPVKFIDPDGNAVSDIKKTKEKVSIDYQKCTISIYQQFSMVNTGTNIDGKNYICNGTIERCFFAKSGYLLNDIQTKVMYSKYTVVIDNVTYYVYKMEMKQRKHNFFDFYTSNENEWNNTVVLFNIVSTEKIDELENLDVQTEVQKVTNIKEFSDNIMSIYNKIPIAPLTATCDIVNILADDYVENSSNSYSTLNRDSNSIIKAIEYMEMNNSNYDIGTEKWYDSVITEHK